MILNLNSNESDIISESGKKGYSLYTLAKNGYHIPDWTIIGKSVFQQFKEYSEINHIIDQILLNINKNFSISVFDKASSDIRNLIMSTPLPGDILHEIEIAYHTINSECIAVRSSVIDKDAKGLSFAGIYKNFFGVNSFEDTIKDLKECWVSAFSSNALLYRQIHNLKLSSSAIEIAVILQKMIDAKKSGVVFTCDPTQVDQNISTINAIYGLGIGLNLSDSDIDTYKVNSADTLISSIKIANKEKQIVLKSNNGTSECSVPAHLKNIPCLGNSEIISLVEHSKKLESIFSVPQEIEWAWTPETGFIFLQSRDICLCSNRNSFLSQSQCTIDEPKDLMLPLAFGFKRRLYYMSSLLLCKLMGMSKKEIHALDPYLEQILGTLFGRTYFNVKNLYHFSSVIFPNAKNHLHKLKSTLGNKFFINVEEPIRECNKRRIVFKINIRKFLTKLKCFWYHFRINSYMKDFCFYFEKTCNYYSHFNFEKMSLKDIYKQYNFLEHNLLTKWKILSINDYLSMIYFKILRFFSRRWLTRLGITLEHDILFVNGQHSLNVMFEELDQVIKCIKRNHVLRTIVKNSDYNQCINALKNSPQNEFNKIFIDYMNKFGNSEPLAISTYHLIKRKLEPEDMPMVCSYSEELNATFSGLKRAIYNWCINNTRHTIQNKKIINFYRTRIYTIVHSMFNGIGCTYAKEKIINSPEDIFYLDFNELISILNGTTNNDTIPALIQLRKEQYKTYQQMDPPSKIITRGPIYYLRDSNLNESKIGRKSITKVQGTGLSGGIAEESVILESNISDPSETKGKILIANGCNINIIRFFPFISAIIIENCSSLSHIVTAAREFSLPLISSAKDITSKLQNGTSVRVNGSTGIIEILNHGPKIKTTFKHLRIRKNI